MSVDNNFYEEVGSPSNLLDLYACRVCLATDIKLFDIHECDLAELFQSVTGELVPPDDGFPQHLCHYCFSLLQKFAIFKEKVTRTHDIMQTASLLNQPITTEFIRNLDRENEGLTLPLTINNTGFIDFEIIEQEATEEEIAEFRIKLEEEEMPEQEVVEDNNEYVDSMYLEQKVEDSFDFGVGQPSDPENQIKITFPQEKDSLAESKALRGLRVTDHPNIEVITLTRAQQIKELIARKETTKYTSSLYKCEKCYRGFLNATTFRNHMVQHNPSSGPVECSICEMRFMTEANLKVHVANIHEKKFVCKLCFHVSSSSHRAIDHQRWHEGVTYNCKYCGQSFKRSTACMVHVRKCHEDQHQCVKCGLECESEAQLQEHVCDTSMQELTETWIQCVDCDCEFNGVDAFNTHLATSGKHGGSDDHVHHCKQCGESFDGEVSLQDHELIHVTTLDVRTNMKPKAKRAKYSVPKSKKPFMCPFCEKGFRFPQYLQIHVRTHTGEKPYVCNICTMAFQAKANLNRHFKVHTGEKPYMCELCGKHFTQSNSMKMHVKTVHFKMPDPYKDRRKYYKCKNRANTMEMANISL